MDFNEQNISILTGSACPPMPLLKSITIHVDSIFNSSTSKHDIIMISAIIKNVWIFFFLLNVVGYFHQWESKEWFDF